jgi:hypothetical protein
MMIPEHPQSIGRGNQRPSLSLLFQTSLEPIGGCVNLELFCTLDIKTWFEQSLVVASETLVGKSIEQEKINNPGTLASQKKPHLHYYGYNKLHYFGVLSLWWDVFCFYFLDTKIYRVSFVEHILPDLLKDQPHFQKLLWPPIHKFVLSASSFESLTLRLGAGRLLGNFDIFTCTQLSDYLTLRAVSSLNNPQK